MFEAWKLMDFTTGEGRELGVFAPGWDDSSWMPVAVPGDVHRALLAAGRIPDPFYDRNETQVAWMEGREFWYRCKFRPGGAPAADERALLIFHGLDTYAVLYLNGSLLGRSRNMFHEAVFDVTKKLLWGQENTLAVRFDPPLGKLDPANPFKSIWGRNPERVFMRKAQFGYGWDWGPRLPTIGIWRPVELKRHKGAALLGVQFNTLRIANDGKSAQVLVRVEASHFASAAASASAAAASATANAGALKAEVRLSIPGEKKPALLETIPLEQAGGLQDANAIFTLDQPHLWWTNGLGEPFLYDLRVTLRRGKEILDRHEQRVGVRTLALDQSPDTDEPGTRFFRFVLNGAAVFAKGANWIPADSFVGAIPAEQYERLLTLARDANMNMLRVWGGGLYEPDIFYDLCDRLGLLVWQDFMFACAMYPEDDTTAALVDAEARYQVRRLRSHPALALWCGNNENQWLHDRNNPERFPEPVPGTLYYDHILPEAVRALDGVTPYWPSSPYGGSDYNAMEDGDRHNWWVWHGGPPRRFGEPVLTDRSPAGVSYRHYAEDSGRFISEFGMHAAPVRETLRRVIPAEQLYHHSPSMDHHNKDNPKNKGDALMESVTGLPRDLDEYIDFSMIAQAEGLKFGIEHFRRRMPHCSGALVWQLNDCWPVLSWSLVDYYGFGKAGYYYTRRVFAPVLASFKEEADGGVSLWLTNDRREPYAGTLLVRLMTFAGQTLMGEPLRAAVPGNASVELARWGAEIAAPDRCLLVEAVEGEPLENRHFFAAIKDLQRAPAAPVVTMRQVSEREVEVVAESVAGVAAEPYVYFFHLTHPDEHTRYSDNYLDIFPGQRRVIRVWNERGPLKVEDLAAAWR